MAPAIGIDLGTTYSCVGVWQNIRVTIIENDQGNRTTPSVVGFTDDERVVGEAAVNQALRNRVNTVFGKVPNLALLSSGVGRRECLLPRYKNRGSDCYVRNQANSGFPKRRDV